VAALELAPLAVAVDLGSGSGDALAALNEQRPLTCIGIDLSTAAAEHAARRFPSLTWVVANADRRLPLLDQRVDLVLSLHGRRNPAEAARVLSPERVLVIAVPAPDDLVEIRTLVQGQGIERERGESMLTEHEPWFTVVERSRVEQTVELERDALLHLLRGTYRGARHAAGERVAALDRMRVTLASDVFVLRRSRQVD
jgi:23S rRNA (guanine745-N1)-methyltransferase